MGTGGGEAWIGPRLVNLFGSSGGGHLAGSMAGLPYARAEVEQNFIVPENVQSLIWEDFVPSLLTSAVLPRFWGVTQNELHAVALYQRAGEEILAGAAENDDLRGKVMDILSDRMLPQKCGHVEAALRAGRRDEVLAKPRPAETLYRPPNFPHRFPEEGAHRATAAKKSD